ncbi:MAG: hypothetical protein CL897_00935 [Dehalococcoidia bacterium]|nr:hypothetical protein [Dehalococcoidia bacterium]|tara:strand:- start:6353 stop:7726 length:1374 start_codon:yes stop_codon:yes gene_type:complete
MTFLTTAFLAESMRAHGYQVIEGDTKPITSGVPDSRLATPGTLFAAFRGEKLDGNDFVGEALNRGASAVICERAPQGNWPNSTLIIADNTRTALAKIARDWQRNCGAQVIGITGTVGKTTAKELSAAAIGEAFLTHRSPGNFNSREGLPLALLSLQLDHEISVLEMAMDSQGEIGELCSIAEPSVGAILNIGTTHLEKLGSVEAIAREKLSLARSLPPHGVAVLNVDDERIIPVINELECRVIGFGKSEAASLRRSKVRDLGLKGSEFRVTYENREAEIRLQMPGAHLAQTALAAIGVQLALGLQLSAAAEAINSAKINERLQVRHATSGANILDDTYNASPDSVTGALHLLRGLGGQRLALLGEMAELGDRSEQEHRRIGSIASECCDVLVAAGESCRLLVEEARANGLSESHWFSTKELAAEFATSRLGEGDHILVKASRGQEFELLIPMLEGQE